MEKRTKYILIAIAIVVIVLVLPIWCTTYYLPGPGETVTEHTACGPFWNLWKVY